MHCASCQQANDETAQFCTGCGAALPQPCPGCGNRNGPTARFCAACGQALRPAATPAPASVVLDSRSAVTGERKLITVMFADIVNSTQLIEDLEPDDAAAQLQAVIEAMRSEIRRFDGTVNKIQGDGLMALFGAPIPQEDHAVRACCAALAMREAVAKLKSRFPALRIGIHTGEVLVQAIRNDLSRQYDAVGIAVHTAARVQQAAAPADIVVSEATRNTARAAIDVVPLPVQPIKGRSQSIALFSLRGIRPAAASAQFRGGQRLSPFVGRSGELRLLEGARDRDAAAATARVVEIVGEAGAGKSRLLFEFLQASRDRGFATIEASVAAHGQSTPLQPILELMRAYFRIAADDTPAAGAIKVSETLEPLGLGHHAGVLQQFLGLPSPHATTSDVSLRRLQLIEAIGDIARTAARRTPAIIAVEDVHWLDDGSKPLLNAFLRGIAGSPSLSVLTRRQGFASMLDDDTGREIIVLAPLGEDAIGAIIAGGLTNPVAELRARLAERAGGNPFFAEELVRAVSATLDERAPTKAAAALPDTVRGIVAYRIDRLNEDEKFLLQAASVLGRDFACSVAGAVAEIPAARARELAAGLVSAQMLYVRDDGTAGDLAFKHPLVHEVTYASLVADERRALHRRAAAALGEHLAARREENAALIGHHWSEGGEPMKAAASYQLAAQWLSGRDVAQALRSWERVRSLLRSVPAEPTTRYMTMLACGQSINFAWRQGIALADVEPTYREAMQIATGLKDARAAVLITLAYGRVLLAAGSADDYIARVEQAQALLATAPDDSVAALLNAVLSQALGISGKLAPALAHSETALAQVDLIKPADRQLLGFEPRYWLWALRARYLALAGRADEAEALCERLVGDATEPVDVLHRALGLSVRLELAVFAHDQAKVAERADQLDALLSGTLTPYLSVLRGRYRGTARLARRQWEDARDLLQETLAFAHSVRAGLEFEPFILADLGDAVAAVDPAAALQWVADARSLAQQRSMRVAEAYALAAKLRVARRLHGATDDAELQQFARLLQETGAVSLRARLEDA